jgi:putative phosphoribosyl transferase
MRLRHTEIGLPAGDCWLDGILAHAPTVPGLIVVAELSHDDERHAPDTWNQVPTLTARLAAVIDWLGHQPALKDLPLGIVCRDAAAAAMIRVAVRGGAPLRALACRGGRPDLAGREPLRMLTLPLLLVAGERDEEAGLPNRQVRDLLDGITELAIVAGASHDFDEPGALDAASRHLCRWFRRWLGPAPTEAGNSP